MSPPRLKVCCLQDERELDLAVAAGAHLLGLVGRGLSGPEVIDDDRITHLARRAPPGAVAVLLTRDQDPAELVRRVVRTRVGVVQICDAVSPEVWAAVRRDAPGVRILQVVHVQGPEALEEAQRVAPHVDAVLLDSGTPQGPNPVYGGSGATHDWQISRQIVQATPGPVWLAGGLQAGNLAAAWATVRPFGVDLCSGVRRDGRLDAARLGAFVAAWRALG